MGEGGALKVKVRVRVKGWAHSKSGSAMRLPPFVAGGSFWK
jgi:hypothetical protein